jgi:hypothetical protein
MIRHLGFAVLASLSAAVTTADASDYSNICRSADGAYEIADETLRRADPNATMPPIPYRRMRETVLAHETGYCTSRKAGDRQFKYETKSTALRARFTDGGQTLELDFICEFVADGLPAAYDCDRRVVTSADTGGKQGDATPPAAGEPHWLHNGSMMRLEASGKGRRFYYLVPRAGIRDVGVRAGTLLFEGNREGNIYAGTAYIFAARCKPRPYAVQGAVIDGDRRIVMTGKAPRIGADCSIDGYRDDTLEFTYQPGEGE